MENQTLEQVTNCNYLECDIGHNSDRDTGIKQNKFRHVCGIYIENNVNTVWSSCVSSLSSLSVMLD